MCLFFGIGFFILLLGSLYFNKAKIKAFIDKVKSFFVKTKEGLEDFKDNFKDEDK